MRKLILSLFAGTLLTSAANAAAPSLPFYKEIVLPDSAQKDVASFEIDENIFLKTDLDYSNARILDEENVETPFLVRDKRRKKTVVREYSVPMENISLSELPDNKIEIILAQKIEINGPLADPIVINFGTAMKNFEKNISVYGSSDKNAWNAIVEDKPIFDYSRFFDISNYRIDITNARYRYYKLIIANITEKQNSPIVNIARETRKDGLFSEIEKTSFESKDFRIDKIEFYAKKEFEEKTTLVTRTYTVNELTSENARDGKETILTFSTSKTPVTKLIILTDDSNFSRKVRIEATNEQDSPLSWKYLADASITKIRMGKFHQDKNSITFGNPQRFKHYRLTVQNLDSPPLTIKSIEAEGAVHETVFFRKQNKSYRITYGSSGIPCPMYDIADVLQKTDGEDTDNCTIGPEKENPDYQKKSMRFSLNSRVLLIAVIVVMVANLFWIIAKTAKKIDTSEIE